MISGTSGDFTTRDIINQQNKTIEKLQEQIKKMKCCTNCKHSPYHSFCNHPNNPARINYKCNLWELKE